MTLDGFFECRDERFERVSSLVRLCQLLLHTCNVCDLRGVDKDFTGHGVWKNCNIPATTAKTMLGLAKSTKPKKTALICVGLVTKL